MTPEQIARRENFELRLRLKRKDVTIKALMDEVCALQIERDRLWSRLAASGMIRRIAFQAGISQEMIVDAAYQLADQVNK
jgi:CRP-like cAMP-binding protein